MIGLCAFCRVITILPLLYIFFYTTKSGISSLNLDFSHSFPARWETGGMANAITGSLIIISIYGIIGIPVGLLTGIYICEYSKSIISTFIKFITDVLSGIPSIIIEYLHTGVIVILMQRFSALGRICARNTYDTDSNKDNGRNA